jgi:hypothetical protein
VSPVSPLRERPVLAHSDALRQRNTSVAFGAKRTLTRCACRRRWARTLLEFQAAHKRIFKAMDANEDGVLTLQEIQDFMRGTKTTAPRQ